MKKQEIKQADIVKGIFRKYGGHIVIGKVFEINTDVHALKDTWISIRVTGGDRIVLPIAFYKVSFVLPNTSAT